MPTSAAKAKILGKPDAEEDDLETKPILKKHKEKSDEKETTEGRKKTLFVGHLSRQTKISDIINFFNYVGEEVVVRVQLIVSRKGEHAGFGFVEFASANEAKKAMEKKNGEYLCGHKIFLDVAKGASYPPRPKYFIDHKVVWYEDYLRQESLSIEENETMEGHDRKTLFVANLSPQTEIIDVCKFFHNVGKVVSLRVIVNRESKHVGSGFVEFVSSNEAKKALEKKNGEYLHDHKIYLVEDYLRPKILMIEEDEKVEGLVEEVAERKKTLFVGHLSPQTEILDICKFFHSVGEVVHVRLIVDHKVEHDGTYGYVEFASSDEAKKALETKNGGNLCGRKIFLDVAKGAKYLPPKYCIDHKVWYLRPESLLIEEDETMEGLVEEVAVRKKTLFVANLPLQSEILDICKFFHNVGKVVSLRLIVNHEGKHVGSCFVEFVSANEANKALKKKKGEYLCGHKIFLDVAKIAPYPPRPKYNLAEKLWYEDYLRRESLLIEEDDLETKPILRFCGTKTTFFDDEEAL